MSIGTPDRKHRSGGDNGSLPSAWRGYNDAAMRRRRGAALISTLDGAGRGPARAGPLMGVDAMIVTISRQAGSRGEDLGRAVAAALDVPFLDHEIIAQAAR